MQKSHALKAFSVLAASSENFLPSFHASDIFW